MRLTAKSSQHVNCVTVAFGQHASIANAHHLRTTAFIRSFLAWKMSQIFRMRRIGDFNDRGAIEFGAASDWIDRLRQGIRAAVMTYVRDPAISLMMDCRLVRRATLKIV